MSSPKLQGETAESAFLHRAVSLGLVVSKPWGDSAPYDFIVDNGRSLFRVQVKSVLRPQREDGAYEINAGMGRHVKAAYTRRHIDVLAACILPEDIWYLIPVEAFTPLKTIRLSPHRPHCRYSTFREAWNLLTNAS
jgi:hypothetical protein